MTRFQCGYCTPGQIMSAVACVHEGHAGTDDEIREYMSGNLCRCAAYPNIVAAIQQAKPQIGRSMSRCVHSPIARSRGRIRLAAALPMPAPRAAAVSRRRHDA